MNVSLAGQAGSDSEDDGMRAGMVFRGFGFSLTLVACAFIFSTCGGKAPPAQVVGDREQLTGETGVSPVISQGVGGADQPRETTLDEALAELDALPVPEGVDEAVFSALKSALREALLESVGRVPGGAPSSFDALSLRRGTSPAPYSSSSLTPVKLVSTPPFGEGNIVDDLELTDNGDGTYTLTWSYRNAGDYNQDGIVNISDITPLAVHFNEPADETNEWIDGNADGVVNIMDITPLAAAFLREVADYLIEGATSIDGPFTEVDSILVSEAEGVDETRARFEYALDPGENGYFHVVARDSEETRAEPSNTVGLALEVLSVAPTEVKEGTVVTFSAEVVGAGPLTYEWDFGGQAVPASSTETSPKVVLTREVGDFPASLTVTSPADTATHNFILHKLARQWVYETVLQVQEPDDEPGVTGGLHDFEGKLYFIIYIYDLAGFGSPLTRYLVSGTPGSWEFEEVDYSGPLDFTSQGAPAILSCVGPFMHYDLTFAEKVGGSWRAQVVVEGLELTTGTFAFARDDVPFVAYVFRYWEPEETEDIRFARRVNGEWVHGILDDAGGLGADVPYGPIVMRVDPDGNPAVAYRVQVRINPYVVRYELRLARWNPLTEEWDKQVVLDNSSSVFDFAFDREGRPCLVYSVYEPGNITLIYARLNGDTWEEDIIEEWAPSEKQPRGYDLAYDALGNPIVAYDSSGYRLFVAWSSGDTWAVTQVASGSGMGIDLLVTEKGTPVLVYRDNELKEVIMARYE